MPVNLPGSKHQKAIRGCQHFPMSLILSWMLFWFFFTVVLNNLNCCIWGGFIFYLHVTGLFCFTVPARKQTRQHHLISVCISTSLSYNPPNGSVALLLYVSYCYFLSCLISKSNIYLFPWTLIMMYSKKCGLKAIVTRNGAFWATQTL
jgi:hypothetical protein